MKLHFFKLFTPLVGLFMSIGLLSSAQTQDVDAVRSQSVDFLIQSPSQSKLADDEAWWTARTESSPYNSASWLGLYKVLRFKDLKEAGKAPSKKYKGELQEIEQKLALIDPNSFEYQLVAYENRFMTDEGFQFLNKAAKLRPENIDIQDDLAAQALMAGEFSDMRRHLQLLRNSGKFNASLMGFHKSLLSGLAPNSIILTHGYVDTYSLLILQELDGLRKDVEILSVDHLINADYREKALEILGVPAQVNIPGEPYLAIELLSEMSSRKIYVATTFPEFWLRGHQNTLYFEGLAFRWSPIIPFEIFDPVNYLEKNIDLASIRANAEISKNYLPLLIQVRNTAKITGRMGLAENCDELIRNIAANSNKLSLILQKLEE